MTAPLDGPLCSEMLSLLELHILPVDLKERVKIMPGLLPLL